MAVVQAIKRGVGGSIVSCRAVKEELKKGILKFIPIEKVKFYRKFYLVLRRGKTRSPLCEAFKSFLLDTSK